MPIYLTLIVWLAAEVVLQVRQFFQGERAKTTEWGSLGMIMLTAFGAGFTAGIVRKHTASWDFTLPAAAWWAVLVVIWAGIAFRLWSIVTLGKYFRGVVHIQEGHQVVRSGPYRVLRHPSYAGLLVALFGLGITLTNPFAILIDWALILFGVWYRIHVEERVLLDGLGEEYADYMRTTNRLIPGVW